MTPNNYNQKYNFKGEILLAVVGVSEKMAQNVKEPKNVSKN